jgi:hypothetical protein
MHPDPRQLIRLRNALCVAAFTLAMLVYLKAQEQGCPKEGCAATDPMMAGIELKKPAKQAYMVCDGRCLKHLSANQRTQLSAPLINGKPDFSRAVIRSVVVDIDENLERVELK